VFEHENVRNMLEVKSFFGMFGLGMAIPIEDSYLHHFMGAMFSHQTCVCLCKRIEDDYVCANNNDNQLLIIGWGTCGGKREVTEAAAAAVVAEGGGQGCVAAMPIGTGVAGEDGIIEELENEQVSGSVVVVDKVTCHCVLT
jgi:hypothetical protein